LPGPLLRGGALPPPLAQNGKTQFFGARFLKLKTEFGLSTGFPPGPKTNFTSRKKIRKKKKTPVFFGLLIGPKKKKKKKKTNQKIGPQKKKTGPQGVFNPAPKKKGKCGGGDPRFNFGFGWPLNLKKKKIF